MNINLLPVKQIFNYSKFNSFSFIEKKTSLIAMVIFFIFSLVAIFIYKSRLISPLNQINKLPPSFTIDGIIKKGEEFFKNDKIKKEIIESLKNALAYSCFKNNIDYHNYKGEINKIDYKKIGSANKETIVECMGEEAYNQRVEEDEKACEFLTTLGYGPFKEDEKIDEEYEIISTHPIDPNSIDL